MHQLLSGAAMTLQPQALDAMGSACWVPTRLQSDMMKDVSANVGQELMMALILSPHPVNGRQAMEAMKVAPQVVKDMAQALAKPYIAKPPLLRQQPSSRLLHSRQVLPRWVLPEGGTRHQQLIL